jgi:hypothetical protein
MGERMSPARLVTDSWSGSNNRVGLVSFAPHAKHSLLGVPHLLKMF